MTVDPTILRLQPGVTGIPEGTAKSRLRLALAKLESVLEPQLLELS